MLKVPGLVGTLSLCVLCACAVHASIVTHEKENSNGTPELKGTIAERSNQLVQIHPWFRTSAPQKVSMVYRTKTTTQVSLKFITKQTTYIKPAPTVTNTEYIAVTITDTEYVDADPITSTVTLTVPLVFTTTRLDAAKTVTLTMPGVFHTVTQTVMNDSPCYQNDVPQNEPIPASNLVATLAQISKLQNKVTDLIAVLSTSQLRSNGRQQQLLGRLQRISWMEMLDKYPEVEKQKQFDWSIDQLDGLKRTLVMQDMGDRNSTGFYTMLELFVNNLERMY